MRLLPLLTSVVLLALAAPTQAASATGQRVLVVLDAALERSSFSQFFGALEQQLGLQLSYKSTKDEKPLLTEFGQSQFEHLLLLAPSAKSLSEDLTPQELVSFLKRGGNVLFGLSPALSESYRDLAREFNIEVEPRGSMLVDHFRALSSGNSYNDSSVLLGPEASTGGIVRNPIVFRPDALKSASESPLFFSGLAHRIGANPLAFPLIRAAPTSYSAEPGGSDGAPLSGAEDDVALVSGFQLRDNSARAIWTGSIDMFSDAALAIKQRSTRDGKNYPSTSNLPVSLSLVSWLTQSHGVLRVAGTSHERVRTGPTDTREDYEEWVEDGKTVQRMYRVLDRVTYHMDLVQHDGEKGWVPAPSDLDLQVSLVMLDPFITTSLSAQGSSSASTGALYKDALSSQSSASTRYAASFILPDRHGVFTFKVDWARHGWTYVATRDTAPVRPFNHDEHPRGLSAAYPYVAGGFSTMVAFALFVVLWTISGEKKRPRAGKEE